MNKKFKLKTYHRAITLAVIVVAVLLNLVVGTLSEKLPLKFDLTENKIFALSKETVNVLKNVNKDVYVYHVVTSGTEDPGIEQAVEMYKGYSDKLHFSKIDPAQDPVFINSLGLDLQSIPDNTIVVKSGDRVRVIDSSTIYDQTLYQYNIIAFDLEIKLTSAIDYVLKEKDINILFTTGHEEIAFNNELALYNTLYTENATISTIDLKTADIPADTAAIYIIGPQRDFSVEELQKIGTYVGQGGSLNVSLDYAASLPVFNQFMNDYYGVSFNDVVVMETNPIHTHTNNVYTIIPQPTEHAITDKMLKDGIPIIWPNSKSITLTEKPDVITTVLFSSSDEAKVVSPQQQEGKTGKYNLAVLCMVDTPSGKQGKVLASGTTLYMLNAFVNEASAANLDFIINSYSYLHGEKVESLAITPKNIALTSLTLTLSDVIFYAIVFGILPPVIILGFGIFVWYKRRRL